VQSVEEREYPEGAKTGGFGSKDEGDDKPVVGQGE
jgi:hypothetical protein